MNFIEEQSKVLVYRKFGACFVVTSADPSDNLLQVFDFLFVFMSALVKYFSDLKWHTIIENASKVGH